MDASRPDSVSLRDIVVRPVRGVEERRRWDELVRQHHYLPYRGLFGKALRHVAEIDHTWLALIGWVAGAFKVTVRDRWIGWAPEQQFRRLHLIASNARFLVLGAAGAQPNLASRVLGLSLRRLSADIQALHGYPVLLAETFIDPSRFSGTCYRAANWQSLGFTSGFSRQPGGAARFRRTGQPKEILVYSLDNNARARLADPEDPLITTPPDETLGVDEIRSLYSYLENMEDFRKPRGQRYTLACYFTIMIAARLAGYRGISAFGEYGALMSQEQLKAAGAFFSPSKNRYTAPAASSFHYLLSSMPPETLDQTIRDYTLQMSQPGTPVAMDGKDVRGASRQGDKHMLVGAIEHGSGLVLGQVEADCKSNEIPALRDLSEIIDLSGRTVTMDALHTQQNTTRLLVEECGADYVVTAVKDNQQTIREDLVDIDWSEATASRTTVDKAHGRIDTRSCRVVDLSATEWDGYCDLYGRQQAIRVYRHSLNMKTGKIEESYVYCLTSLTADEACPDTLLNLIRHHWHIENRLHYVRDFTYDEDRCRAHVRHLPQNLACLTNAAISIIRMQQRFKYIPEANRYYQCRMDEALDRILLPPTP